MRGLLLATVFICASGLPLLHGQAAPPLTFETASVKPNQSRVGQMDGSLAGGRLALRNATLHDLVRFAYQRQDGRLRNDSEIAGGPTWQNADRFDVIAKADGPGLGIDAGNTGGGAATPAALDGIIRVRMMLRALLADRFKLTVRNEPGDVAVYALVTDRSDGKPGPQLKAVDSKCCVGFRMTGMGRLSGRAVTMTMLATFLEGSVSRIVLDRTNLRATFDLDLQWTPDPPQRAVGDAPTPDVNSVSVFTAVREQLGLKLESTKAPVDVLVIERAEKPTPD